MYIFWGLYISHLFHSMKAKKQISSLALLSIIVLLTACTSSNTSAPASPTPVNVPASSQYKDGTYTGTGKYSFPGGSVDYSVPLTLVSDTISAASFASFTESGNKFYSRAQGDAALQKIVGTTNRTIDTVTGATGTSTAVQDAINDAMTQAKN